MVELEINSEVEQVEPPAPLEKPLEIDEVILEALCNIKEDLEDIVIIDYIYIQEFFDKIKGINTVRRLMDVEGLGENITKCFNMIDEESKSTKQSRSFLKIISGLFSNTEADYFKIFNGVTND